MLTVVPSFLPFFTRISLLLLLLLLLLSLRRSPHPLPPLPQPKRGGSIARRTLTTKNNKKRKKNARRTQLQMQMQKKSRTTTTPTKKSNNVALEPCCDALPLSPPHLHLRDPVPHPHPQSPQKGPESANAGRIVPPGRGGGGRMSVTPPFTPTLAPYPHTETNIRTALVTPMLYSCKTNSTCCIFLIVAPLVCVAPLATQTHNTKEKK